MQRAGRSDQEEGFVVISLRGLVYHREVWAAATPHLFAVEQGCPTSHTCEAIIPAPVLPSGDM